jgi:Domain of unknown function (DUF397)
MQNEYSMPLWRKSRASDSGETCVEVATQGSSVLIRDSWNKSGPILVVASHRWCEFMTRILDGSLTATEND